MYVKLAAPDQLLLSEAVCCQLGIVSYHPSVQSVWGCHSAETPRPTSNSDREGDTIPVINKRTVPVEQPRTEELAQQVADGFTLQMERVDQPAVTAVASKKSETEKPSEATGEVKVPQSRRMVTTRVSLIKSVCLPAPQFQCKLVRLRAQFYWSQQSH